MNTLAEPNVGSPLFYTIFAVVVAVMLLVDLFSLKKNGVHTVRTREALVWSIVWVAVSCLFAGWLYWELAGNPQFGKTVASHKVMEFFTAYVLEKSLAVDNIFVFLMIFSYFRVPPQYQHRVLLYGVLGAIVMRIAMISLGAALVARFSWILYLFGIILVITGIKMLLPEKEDGKDLSQNVLLKFFRRFVRVSDHLDGEKFFTAENGRRIATPLFLVVLMIEASDIVFAVDSIPAVFAVTTDTFILITSNIFAILGLRAMYFLLANIAERVVYLRYGLAFVLTFVGIKMLIVRWVHVPVGISLTVVFSALALSVAASYVVRKKPDNA